MSEQTFNIGDVVRYRDCSSMTVQQWAPFTTLTPDGCLEVEGVITGSRKCSGFPAYAIDASPLGEFIALPNQLTLVKAAQQDDAGVEPSVTNETTKQAEAA